MLTNNSTETVSQIPTLNVRNNPSDNKPALSTQSVPEPTIGDEPFIGTSKTRKCEYIDLDDEEIQRKFLSANSTNKKGENEYRGKYLKGNITEQIREEMSKCIKDNTLESVKFLVGRKPGKPEITARIVLSNLKKEINVSDFLMCETCKQCNVKAVTLLLPDQDEKRGMRLRIDENVTRIYEVANGSYQMTLKWYVEGKECNIKVNIHDNGSVELIESNGVTKEQLAANNVKVGKQYEAKPLHEALASQLPQTQLQQSSEAVKFLPQPSMQQM